MTAATLTAADTLPAPRTGPTFARLLRAEWIKLWSLRSTLWVLSITVLSQVGLAALIAWVETQPVVGEQLSRPSRADLLASTVQFSQLTIAVIAVLTITGEYRTGQVRSTFAADPRRLPTLAAKLVVLLAVAFATTAVGTALSWATTLVWLSPADYPVDLGDAEQLRQLVGAPLYVTGIALLAYAFGALLRHSAGAIASVLGLLLVVETVVSAIPLRLFVEIGPYLPSRAGSQILFSDYMTSGRVLTPWQGYGILLAWGAVILAVATVLIRRRDA